MHLRLLGRWYVITVIKYSSNSKIPGLTLVQKIITSCPSDSITISTGVQKALLKNGLFTFEPFGSVLVPPLGQVELFKLSDPTEDTHESDNIFFIPFFVEALTNPTQ
jgi:hypothetical protein